MPLKPEHAIVILADARQTSHSQTDKGFNNHNNSVLPVQTALTDSNLHLHGLSVNASNPLHTLNHLQMSEEQDSDQETQDDGRDDRVPMEQAEEKDLKNELVDKDQNTLCGIQGNGSIACAPGAAAESPDLHNNEPIDISYHTRSLRGDLRLSPTNYERIVKARSSYNVQLADTDRAASDNGYDDGLEYDEFLVMSTAERDVRAAFRSAACAAEGRYHDEKSNSTVIVLGL